jgi:hypothetical protein
MKAAMLLITLALGILMAPLTTEAQPPAPVFRIAELNPSPAPGQSQEVFRQRLRDLGYVLGQTIRLEYRSAEWQLDRLPDCALGSLLPAMMLFTGFAEDGGLLAYGPNLLDIFRKTGGFLSKILNGAAPENLPVERPAKFELLINLKTAQALGLTIPPTLLFQADKVIR